MKYDVHTHAFHPKIAEKAVQQLNDYYRIKPQGDGDVEMLLREITANALDVAVVHCAATTAAQVQPANDWAIYLQTHYPQIRSFGTFHPDFTDWENELTRLRAAGIRGLKIHPEFQSVWLNDPRLTPIFAAAENVFTVMFHIGDEKPPAENFSCPFKLAAIKKQFPRMQMIAAHLGGYRHWEHVVAQLADTDIFIDTSSSLAFIDDALLADIRRQISWERWLFGSDYPLSTPTRELDLVKKRLQLTARELDALLSNAARFFQ